MINKMKTFIQKYGWGMYLAGCLGGLGFTLTTWQYWATFVPTVLLVEWSKSLTK